MTYLVDSDMLIYYFNHMSPFDQVVANLLRSKQDSVAISVLSVAELCAGWSGEEQTQYLPLLYDLFTVESVTSAIAERAGAWRYQYMQQERKLKLIDTLIAATVVEYEYCLVTHNHKDYPMPELRMYKDFFPYKV